MAATSGMPMRMPRIVVRLGRARHEHASGKHDQRQDERGDRVGARPRAGCRAPCPMYPTLVRKIPVFSTAWIAFTDSSPRRQISHTPMRGTIAAACIRNPGVDEHFPEEPKQHAHDHPEEQGGTSEHCADDPEHGDAPLKERACLGIREVVAAAHLCTPMMTNFVGCSHCEAARSPLRGGRKMIGERPPRS